MKKFEKEIQHRIHFNLNGEDVEGNAEPRMLLTDFLRHEIGATGTHVGCEHGICGACTILINGKAMRSCLMLAVQVNGNTVETVEGLAESDGSFSALQQAFHENFALQCGYCTPGFLMTLSEYLKKNPEPTDEEIKIALSGNICRCTGYHEIINAALDAAKMLRQS
tara:strand:- start:25 stop:522 length:498 start_codon:yes stop_codon:yes gene_type:complete